MQPRLSLKARAIQLLSQREQSRLELRRKLLKHARAELEARAESLTEPTEIREACEPCVDKLLDWLEAHGYLSQQRFVESRVHARQSRFGTRRITQELSQHGVAIDGETLAGLRETEVERARDVWRRKFGQPPTTPAEQARQSRFLLLRGFSGDAVKAAVGRVRASADDEAA